VLEVLVHVRRASKQTAHRVAFKRLGEVPEHVDTRLELAVRLHDLEEVRLLDVTGVDPRDQPLEIRQTLGELGELPHKVWVRHQVVHRVKPGVDCIHVAQRRGEPDPEQTFAKRSLTSL
jgi:hypothetical protein